MRTFEILSGSPVKNEKKNLGENIKYPVRFFHPKFTKVQSHVQNDERLNFILNYTSISTIYNQHPIGDYKL